MGVGWEWTLGSWLQPGTRQGQWTDLTLEGGGWKLAVLAQDGKLITEDLPRRLQSVFPPELDVGPGPEPGMELR